MKNTAWLSHPDPEIEHELFVLGYRNLSVHCIGQVSLSSLVAAGLWSIATRSLLLAWMGGVAVSVMVLLLGMWAFREAACLQRGRAKTLHHWRWVHPLLLCSVGITWGAVGALMAAPYPVHNLMVMVAFTGVMAYSALSNAPNNPVGFGVSAALGVSIMMLQLPHAFGDQAGFVFGMCAVYFVVLVLAARNARATLLTSIELRRVNEVLAQTNAQNAARAEQANRDKSAFLAAASHDLRQPVHALLLLIEAYRQEVPSAASHPIMHNIAAAGHSIRSLFNALMELSRLESGTEKPVMLPCDLLTAVQQAMDSVRPQAQRKGLQLRYYQPPDMLRYAICTDRYLLERVVGNLLSNAVNYTAQGGVLLSLRKARQRGGLWLEVWDTGIGIDAADHARIFDPYVQVGNRERDRSKGLGLGLAIVHHSVSLLGMPLRMVSRVGKGSCFRLHIPAHLQVSQPSADQTQPRMGVVHMPSLAGRRILLVDDDPMVRDAMQALLQGWGVDLRYARAGDTAQVLQVCGADWVPECVLSDFRMPGPLDGIALLDALQEHYPQAVGILQTGELAPAVQERAEEAGYMVLFKPVDAGILASTLSAVLQRNGTLETA